MQNLFFIQYHVKLIKSMAKSLIVGIITSSIIVPLLCAFILYDFLPHNFIYIWLFLHSFILTIRIYINTKLLSFLEDVYFEKYIQTYLIWSLVTIFFTAILYGLLIYLIYISNVPDPTILLITILILAMTAGSSFTLIHVFISFVLFVCITVIPLIIFALFHGGDTFFILAIILFIYLFLYTFLGYRRYVILRNGVFLEDTFKSIYDKSSNGIILIENGRIKDCNEAILNMFQYDTKEELLACKISNFMPKLQEDGTSSLRKMLKIHKLALDNKINSFEWMHKRKSGEVFWTEVVLTKIYLDGKVIIHETVREIGDRKRLEIAKESANKEIEVLNQRLIEKIEKEVSISQEKDRRLLQQSRMAQMGEMISMIAHQWRQPLAAISSTSASLELKASLNKLNNDIVQEKAQDISFFAQHLSKTIDDFRNFFKPNKIEMETSYDKLIVSVINIIGVSIGNKDIKLIQDLKCHDSFISYPNELKQVILNLIKNAEDALLEKQIKTPYIKISTYKEKDKLILEVNDNAGGIPEEIVKNIFDLYFSTKTQKDGTGLGLYMSKMIIEEHCGGKLSVINAEDGALFRVVLNKA